MLIITACRPGVEPPSPQSFFGKWLLIDQPGLKLTVGDMWDGIGAETGCYTFATRTVDTINQVTLQSGTASRDISFGAKLLSRIGLSAARERSQSWTIYGKGSRVMTAKDLQPHLGPECQTKGKDELPRYPVIATMIAYDTLLFFGREASGVDVGLSEAEIGSVVQITGGSYQKRDSLHYFTFVEGAWVGYQLWMLKSRKTRKCKWTIALESPNTCPKDKENFPHSVMVRDLHTGYFEVTVQNPVVFNAQMQRDTVRLGFFTTIGRLPQATGTRGVWYSLTIPRRVTTAEVEVEIVRRDYDVIRFRNESDRKDFDRHTGR